MAELPESLFATLAAAVETAWSEVEALVDGHVRDALNLNGVRC